MMKAKVSLQLYVIRQKSTGKMMPEVYWKKGYTHTEPISPYIAVPRLFSSKAGAARALGHWLNGKQSAFAVGDDIIRKIVTVPDRDPEDMEIVEARLELP